MRRVRNLELGQLIAFVALAVVLNAQYTWWLYYSLRENRARLDLQRQLAGCRVQAAALRLKARAESGALTLWSFPTGVIPAAFPPFSEISVSSTISDPEVAGWNTVGGRQAFVRPFRRGWWLVGVVDSQAPYRWLEDLDPRLRLVDSARGADQRPTERLGAPFENLSVTVDLSEWNELVNRYRRRVVLVLSEGAFFVVAMITGIALMWRVLRREGALEREQQSFISAVTHELKTPIAGIRLSLETVISGRTDAEGRGKFLSNALADVERLANLVEKILEVTRYAGGGHRLSIAVGDLSILLEDEVSVAERHATPRGAVLEADIAPGVQASFDPEAIAIVLSNLIENAIKYAQGSPPRVWVRLAIEHGEAVIEVRDNGVGLASRELERIFQPFYRVGDEITRRTPGTGIGLYVAREIVRAHGGRLTATSAGPGSGATFRFTLPGAELLPEEEF
jgi:two-component system phosphate regulon sensor histidine kinase PhoR